MRYPDGGGLTASGRARREVLRLQAAGLFTDGVRVAEIASRLRVSGERRPARPASPAVIVRGYAEATIALAGEHRL
jgi:hypothetical protein